LRVELLAYTPNPQEIVALAAKLCYSSADINALKQGVLSKEQDKFISRLAEMGHLSPVEHASFTFGVEGVSRSLLAQITRHRIASFSVKSQRYVSERSKSNIGDGSIDGTDLIKFNVKSQSCISDRSEGERIFNYIIPAGIKQLGKEHIDRFASQMAMMQKWYDEWLEVLGNGKEASNEDARFVLPNACETKFIVSMNARELMHFFNLRCCNRAQWEIRELANQMLRKVLEVAPALFSNAGPSCISGVCPESDLSCGRMSEVIEEYNMLLASAMHRIDVEEP
jgi:thymidylate synthase (FAD)